MPSYYCKKSFGVCSSASLTHPSNLGKGMEKLLNNSNNLFTLVKSTDAIMAGSIIKVAKKREDELTATTDKTVLTFITA
jgi:hypothetical protein